MAWFLRGENFGERRSTLNLGVGYRQLLEQGQSIAGVNLFTDYESKSKHKRGSVGLEYQRANFNLNVNKYFPCVVVFTTKLHTNRVRELHF
jgi:hypothetical protein